MALSKKKEQEYIEKVRKNGLHLKRITKNQTPEICLEAVKEDGRALEHVKEQTPEICLEAVRENGRALKFVKEQTPEICLEAVKENGWALEYVKEQTEKICLEAVKENGRALEYVKEQTEKICLEAVKEDGWALMSVKERTEELCLTALFKNTDIYKYINLPTDEMKVIKEILKENELNPYRQIRSRISSGEIESKDSPYHVLECLGF